VVTPIYGKLSDLYGRRSTLLIAVSIFVAGSIACALSQNMLMLIIARTFQGLGGGGLISLSQTVIGDVISPKERPRYQAYISGVFVIASLAGPLLGGFIAEHLHWSLIFWINPPIGLLALLPMYSLLRKLPVDRQHHRITLLILLGFSRRGRLTHKLTHDDWPGASEIGHLAGIKVGTTLERGS
jgi:MFS family permease